MDSFGHCRNGIFVKRAGVNPKGATGVMVRTLLEYLLRLASDPVNQADTAEASS